jgi:hypothetical protein
MVELPYLSLITMHAYSEGRISVYERRLYGIQRGPEERKKLFEKISKDTMQHFFALDVSGELSRPWLFAVTVYIWTAFECLAGDLWASSLNHATALAHKILASIPNEDSEKSGLSRRHIEVGLAARYGFDLRRRLGTVLKAKFDFSSIDGIQAAYKQAFGTCGGLEGFHDVLMELEQVRHLIVHRGGVADAKFAKITKLKVKPEAKFSLKLSKVGLYMMSVTLGSVALLNIVDDWFAAQK